MEVTHGNTPVCGHRRISIFNLQLLHFDLVTYQEGGKKIDLGIREKSCVHHQEIQFPGCNWKISPTVRAAGLSLAGVTGSQNG